MKKAFPNYRVQDEVYIGEGLYLDIELPDFACAVELHGKQHYEFSPFYHNDAEGWADQQRRDKRKKEICEREGKIFIVFRYDEPIDDVEFVKNRIVDSILGGDE